jgi:protein-tyrosine phosphatase
MGEVVLAGLVADTAQLGHVQVSSAGTANWHVGKEMDPRTRRALDRAGFTGAGSPARFASPDYLDELDLVIVMTREHRSDVNSRRRRADGDVVLLRSLLDDRHELDLADPYYGDDQEFDEALSTIIRACREVVRALLAGESSAGAPLAG